MLFRATRTWLRIVLNFYQSRKGPAKVTKCQAVSVIKNLNKSVPDQKSCLKVDLTSVFPSYTVSPVHDVYILPTREWYTKMSLNLLCIHGSEGVIYCKSVPHHQLWKSVNWSRIQYFQSADGKSIYQFKFGFWERTIPESSQKLNKSNNPAGWNCCLSHGSLCAATK